MYSFSFKLYITLCFLSYNVLCLCVWCGNNLLKVVNWLIVILKIKFIIKFESNIWVKIWYVMGSNKNIKVKFYDFLGILNINN